MFTTYVSRIPKNFISKCDLLIEKHQFFLVFLKKLLNLSLIGSKHGIIYGMGAPGNSSHTKRSEYFTSPFIVWLS